MFMKHAVKYKPCSKVVAGKAPYQVNELIKEIQDTVYNVASKYLKAEGWDTSDIADYFRVDVQQVDPGVIRAEIRGELHYEELSELCSQLDKVIVVKFDRDAYFEPVEPGIAEAFIHTGVEACSNVTASLDEDLVFIDNRKSSIVNNDPSLDPGFDEYDIYSPEDLEKDANAKACSNVTASASSQFTMQDVQALIDDYGTEYFEATPTSGGRKLWFCVFDVGSYNIRIEDGKIIMISTDDPNDDVRIFRSLEDFRDYLEKQIAIVRQKMDMNYCANASTLVTSSLNYVTPEMKQLKRAISKIYVDNDDQFHELVNSLLNNEPINLVPETRALKLAIDSLVVDSEEEKRTLVYEVAKDLGVINSSYNVDVCCADADSDDALWDVIDDEEFEFRGVQDVGYDNDGSIMVIFNHAISEDMIEPTAEELLTAFRQYGYPVHEWNTNGYNVFILSRGGILGSTTNASTYDDLDEELLDILDELSDMGYDIHDEADIKMGLGAGLGYDKQDQKLIMKDLRKRKMIASSTFKPSIVADDQIEDGWGTDVRGILDIPFARAEDLMYEIRNTIRGAYTDCETVEDLADYIRQLASEFEDAADELESL